jgi:hypothetical protein
MNVECKICGHTFSNTNALSKHKSRHHGKRDHVLQAESQQILNAAQPHNTSCLRALGSSLVSTDVMSAAISDDRLVLESFNLLLDSSVEIAQRKITRINPLEQPRTFVTKPRVSTTPLSPRSVFTIVNSLLQTVSKSDVRQPSGRIDHNTGEIAPEAVTMIIEQFDSLSVDDVFLDVGSGVGNVILQVALQSSFRQCVGLRSARSSQRSPKRSSISTCSTTHDWDRLL